MPNEYLDEIFNSLPTDAYPYSVRAVDITVKDGLLVQTELTRFEDTAYFLDQARANQKDINGVFAYPNPFITGDEVDGEFESAASDAEEDGESIDEEDFRSDFTEAGYCTEYTLIQHTFPLENIADMCLGLETRYPLSMEKTKVSSVIEKVLLGRVGKVEGSQTTVKLSGIVFDEDTQKILDGAKEVYDEATVKRLSESLASNADNVSSIAKFIDRQNLKSFLFFTANGRDYYDAQTGERLKELYRETSTKYVEPLHPIVFLPWDDSQYIMQSQKDGYNHLYLCSADDGRIIRQLTSGPWVVMDLLGFNTADKSVIISSNEKSPIQRNTYAVSLKNGKRTLLDNGKGYHYAELSASGQWMKDSWSEPDVPRMIAVVKTKNKASKLLFEADDPWKEYKKPEYVSGCIKAADGETDLFYRMVKPVDFDPNKKYPTIIYVYGGPHAHNVDARWNYCSRGWETYMAQKGYLMFILDNRGSENRGRDFEQATFRQLGQIEMQDQIKGVEFLKSLPYVDANRIGVHGWSFGGFMTISLMTNYPDIFKVGVAGGPVIDWKWYEVMYGERYMDTPQQNPDGYAKTSLLSMAKNLKGKLQIISGYNDNTVVPQHCLSFIYQCNLNGTQPDLYIYPGEGHNMRGHQSTHLHERISQYFDDYLK